jgi:hypothetical protein
MNELVPAATAPNPLSRFFGVLLDRRSYLSVAYLWLAFPLGLFYFVLLVTGFSLGLPLILIWVGLGVLFVLMLAVWGLAGLERILASRLLGAAVGPPLGRELRGTAGQRLRALFTGGELWKGLVFLFLKFPLGLAGWIVSVVTLSVSIGLTLAPVAAWAGGRVQIDGWIADGPVVTTLLSAAGILLFFVTLHLHNGLAWGWKALAEALLGRARHPVAAG